MQIWSVTSPLLLQVAQIWKMLPLLPRNCLTECFIPRKNHSVNYMYTLVILLLLLNKEFCKMQNSGPAESLMATYPSYSVYWWRLWGLRLRSWASHTKQRVLDGKHDFIVSGPSLQLKRRNWTRAKGGKRKMLLFILFTQSCSAS